MDLDSIKVIADTATQLTGEAKQIFIWWLLGKEVLRMVLNTVGLLAAIIAAYKIAQMLVGSSSPAAFIKQKRDEYETGIPGPLTANEINRTIKEINRRLNRSNSNE